MEDVNISKYRASVVREGSKPASPGFVVSEGQSPTDPAGTGQNHLPVTIAAASTGLSITESQILSGAGTVSQYIRGDGSLADFPEASGGGSSISYYLNGSVNQGTIGGVAYRELSKIPVLGAGTDFSINANGYIASFITDAGDPSLLEIPGGNWNFETYFSASSGGGSPTFYVELYKVSGTTATLIASNSGSPELIAFGTTLTSYFSTLAVPTTTLALTDRLAIRYYVTHSGRTITLHTEDNHLCQIITTFTTGLTALNGLTAQVQNFAVGTSGTDFNIASATATHTFNLPTASATNRGALSSADWTIFNNKENAITAGTTAQYFRGDKTFQTLNTSVVPELTNLYYTEARVNANTNVAANTAARHNAVTLGTANGLSLSTQVLSLGLASAGVTGALSGTDWSTFNNKQNALGFTPVPETRTITINGTTQDLSANRTFNVGTVTSVGLSSATSGVTIGSTPVTSSGTITLAIATASGSQNGLLSSTDWTTFNNKQNALTNPVTGTGTTNYLPKFTGASTIGNSQVFDNGTNVGIGTATPSVAAGLGLVLNGQAGQTRLAFKNNYTGDTSGDGVQFALIGGSSAFVFQNRESDGYFSYEINGNEVFRTSGTNLLVGTTTDNGAKLQVSGSGAAASISNASDIWYNVTRGSSFTNIGVDSIGSFYNTNTNHRFLTNSGSITAMTITSSGNVGIGTASPATYGGWGGLDVRGANGGHIIVANTGGTNRGEILTDGNGFNVNAQTNNALLLKTNDTTRMFITSSGNVGIGTTSPTAYSGFTTLTINGQSGSNGGVLRLTAFDNSSSFNIYAAGSAANFNTTSAIPFIFYTQDTERMRITSSGNVGIGTTSPAQLFTVRGTATNLISLHYSNDAGGVGYGIYNSAGTELWSIGGGRFIQQDELAISRQGVAALYINSSRNVLIGTTTDNGAKLNVNGTIRSNDTYGFAIGSIASYRRIQYGSDNATSFTLLTDGNAYAGLYALSANFSTTIKTGNPTGSTSDNWLLGRALVSGSSTPDRWIRVQIGNLYYDILSRYIGSV